MINIPKWFYALLIIILVVVLVNKINDSMSNFGIVSKNFKNKCPPGYEVVASGVKGVVQCWSNGEYMPAQAPKGAKCKPGESSVNYGGRLDCYGPGDYPNLTYVYPKRKDCHIEAGNNNIIAFTDAKLKTEGWRVKHGQTLDRKCFPGGFRVKNKVK